jgi:hypothetical protein
MDRLHVSSQSILDLYFIIGRLQSVVGMRISHKWTTRQFCSLSRLGITNLEDLEEFTSIVNLLNSGLFNEIH